MRLGNVWQWQPDRRLLWLHVQWLQARCWINLSSKHLQNLVPITKTGWDICLTLAHAVVQAGKPFSDFEFINKCKFEMSKKNESFLYCYANFADQWILLWDQWKNTAHWSGDQWKKREIFRPWSVVYYMTNLWYQEIKFSMRNHHCVL